MNVVSKIDQSVQQIENYNIGLTSLQGFELAQRAAKLMASSTLVPKEYQGNLSNCVIALNMATRLGADPLMVMQNLVVVHGRPTWSSQFLIATVNTCGRFSALRYEFFGDQSNDTWGCRAWAVEKATNEKLIGTDVTIAIAKKEGWYGKNGSKWQSIPQQMLMYRAGSWWTRVYAPELSMGLHTAEEISDIIDLNPDGSISSVTSGRVPPRPTYLQVEEEAEKPKERKVPPRQSKQSEPRQQVEDVKAEPIDYDPETGEIITDPFEDEARAIANEGAKRLRFWLAKQGDESKGHLEPIMDELTQRAKAADERSNRNGQ